jgi:hypothetical protein
MKLVALVCAAVLIADRPAEACSCAPPPPPCEVFSRAGAVFVGKVTSTRTTPDHETIATFAVEKVFKGLVLVKTIDVHGGGMCGATFRVGEKYFVYASDTGGHWYAGLCGRTRRLGDAQDDLAHARNLPSRTLAELLGTVRLEDEQGRFQVRAGAVVVAQGTAYSTTTDQAGRFKLQVPPGKYTLDVVDPGTHVLWGRLPTLEVTEPSACASEDLVLRYNGRIRGTLVDHTGKPAANVALSAQGGTLSGALRAVSNASGAYEIEGVQAGRYLVVVNHPNEGGPHAGSPIPTTFYPGVATEAAAKPVAMTRSGLVEDIDFKLPRPLPVYTVTGVLKQQGKPMPAVYVKLDTELGNKYGRGTIDQTDARGRFTFKDIAGAKLTLEVCRPDANPENYRTACRTVRQTLTRDWNVDLEYPAP